MPCLRVLGELCLEALDLDSKGVRARLQKPSESVFQFMLDMSVLLLESDETHGAPAPRRDCCLHNRSLPFSGPKELWQPAVHYGMGRRAHASFNKLNIVRGVYFRREFAALQSHADAVKRRANGATDWMRI